MNLWTKKHIVTLAVLAAVIFVVAAVNYRITQHIVNKTIAAQQEDLAVKAANTVEMWLEQQMKILTATADSITLSDLGQNDATLKPLKMAMKAGHFTDVYIGRDDGVLIDGADWLPPEGYDPRARPWYRRASETGMVSFTTPYIDLVTNKLVIALVKPLIVKEKTVAVMGADTVLDTLVQNVLNFKVSETGYGFIVERNGTILVHPNQRYVMREKLQHIEPDLGDKLDGFISGNLGTVTYLGNDRQNHVLSYSLIANSDWFMCVTAPRDEAYSLTRKTTMIFATEVALKVLSILAFIALVVIGGSGLLLFFFSKRYSTAIQQHQEELTGINKDLEWNIIKRKEVETYYQTLFNVANDAILISKDSRITECNHKALDTFGFPKDILLEKSLIDISPTYQPDGVLSDDKLQEIMQDSEKGEQQAFRWSFLRADGTEFPASISLKIFRLGDEDLTLSSIRDISKRVDAEGQLMQAQKMAAVGEMLAIIAHQWRQPLNTLSTYISSLQAAQYNDMLNKSFVDKLVSGASGQIHFMSKTIDDFRNFFKPSKSKGPVDVLEVIISAVKLMEAQMKHGGISLTVNNKTNTSSLLVFGYRGEFVHVLVNIIANAKDAILQHAENAPDEPVAKKIEITVSTEEQTVLITISDSGGGIPEHLLLQIFNPYFTTKGASSGTGMGLYMSKMIVEKEMNGELLAENTPLGARFTIKLKKMIPGSAA
ncbi:PAS domain S-box protein [Desulfopila sp. IMCC35006]|uniref:cache domain-containing protein n=1 Tax=Desulfopila sp. IMCC35006 TaxID=2569542 RepID=UPI0010AC983E|nr:cache domain-containing protein [Desulfopila sp. IMCC35006]TKB23861.1 PAS domain S-box protein [Desulfopila sp. IMCC35006]